MGRSHEKDITLQVEANVARVPDVFFEEEEYQMLKNPSIASCYPA
jgi:hypothetical protein